MGGALSRAAKPRPGPLKYPVHQAKTEVQQAAAKGGQIQASAAGAAPAAAAEATAGRPTSAALQALFDEEERPDRKMTDFYKQIGGSIHGHRMDTRGIQPKAMPRMSSEGRLSTADLRSLFKQRQQQSQQDVEALARQYGVDPALLQSVLRYNRLPVITTADDGRLLGR
ncbi:hypothetical protein WJX72_009843 [[Myrmecia] bisecta]|uniref:Uncharacterized protein n=1 Tax=[Myrmecia] bisecta TaxID=41462 RepID=A0AAW1R8X9_9CHLO